LSLFRFNKGLGIAQHVKAFLKRSDGDFAHEAAADACQREERAGDQRRPRRATSEQSNRLKSKKQELRRKGRELRRIRNETRAAKDDAERIEHKKRKKTVQQDIFQLSRELRAAEEELAGESQTGALPDFVIIGTAKGGTTSLYHLLTRHPHVEPAAAKELHFFDNHFSEGIQWYRRCFPTPRLREGKWTITGEATPCLGHPDVPERMAKVLPQARLIVMLRNPVDRAYSMYHHRVRNGHETRTFEEVVEADLNDGSVGLLSRSIYVDHLVRWSEFFSEEQLLVLKSEDLFERPLQTLKVVLDFLDLPDWEPEVSKLTGNKRNEGRYEEMNPSTRRKLEEYFEPHNQRLYEFLGVDFGW